MQTRLQRHVVVEVVAEMVAEGAGEGVALVVIDKSVCRSGDSGIEMNVRIQEWVLT